MDPALTVNKDPMSIVVASGLKTSAVLNIQHEMTNNIRAET